MEKTRACLKHNCHQSYHVLLTKPPAATDSGISMHAEAWYIKYTDPGDIRCNAPGHQENMCKGMYSHAAS